MTVVTAPALRVSGPPQDVRWAVVDVETSGLRASQNRVLSVAVLTLDAAGELTEEFSTLLDPGCDPGPVHIHGLTRQRLRGAPTFEQVAEQIAMLLKGRVMVAHNAQFDYEFLAHEFARARSWLPVSRRLCTLALNRRVCPPTEDLKLATLAAHYRVPQSRAHDALDDARVLAGILRGSLAAAGELGLDLPLVDCPPKQRTGYPPRVPKTPCVFTNPGPLHTGGPLVQGMKIAFTGDTHLTREELTARSVAAGLNVVTSVSRHTSALIANGHDSDTTKAHAARSAGVPVIAEEAFLALLADVKPGTAHQRQPAAGALPAPRRERPVPGRLTGHRVLVLGGPHRQAAALRSRITALGGAAAVNLSAGVTDVILLPGGEDDRRMPRITARDLPVHGTGWLDALESGSLPPEPDLVTPTADSSASTTSELSADTGRMHVLPRGGVIDLPRRQDDPDDWRVTATWAHQTTCELDVVAFTLDEDEQVSCDEDFVFYGAPESADGSVRLSTDGPCEQAISIDQATLPTSTRKVVIAAAIDGPATFGQVGAIEITVSPGAAARPLAQATLDAATTECTMLLAEFYRRGHAWRIRAVGQGYDHGLATLARGFGVDVDD